MDDQTQVLEPIEDVTDVINEQDAESTESLEEPLSAAESLLNEISNAESECREREAEVDEAKEDLKVAKANYDRAVTRLRKLANQSENDSNRPLLDLQNDATESDENDDWQSLSISVLWEEPIKGFGESKQEAILDEIPTLGAFEKLRQLVGREADHLCKLMPKGVGETLADELENRHLDYVAKFSGSSDVDESKAFILEKRIGELGTENPEWLSHIGDSDIFNSGIYAFQEGDELSECPYEAGEDQDDWLRGYCHAEAVAELENGEMDIEPEESTDEFETVHNNVSVDEL